MLNKKKDMRGGSRKRGSRKKTHKKKNMRGGSGSGLDEFALSVSFNELMANAGAWKCLQQNNREARETYNRTMHGPLEGGSAITAPDLMKTSTEKCRRAITNGMKLFKEASIDIEDEVKRDIEDEVKRDWFINNKAFLVGETDRSELETLWKDLR